MKQINPTDYHLFLQQAEAAAGDFVYPRSIAEGRQSGEIYTHGDAVLFHHFCGFAYLSGNPEQAFLEKIRAQFFDNPAPNRRFLLITDQPNIAAYYTGDSAILAEQRLYFRADHAPQIAVPEGYSLSEVTPDLLPRLKGRIVPAFSWESDAQYLQNGIGYCVLHGDEVAAWAFSAAVTAEFVDIGVETREAFRQKGLAGCAAAAVMQAVISQGKTPVWACHAQNIGSSKTAQALGFHRTHICTVLHRNS